MENIPKVIEYLNKRAKKNIFTEDDLDLEALSYEENYVFLEKTAGTPQHSEYVKRERALNALGATLKDKLNILAKDNCPRRGNVSCGECSDQRRCSTINKPRERKCILE